MERADAPTDGRVSIGASVRPGCCDSQPVRRRFGYSENMSGFCSTMAPASVSPVMTMCL